MTVYEEAATADDIIVCRDVHKWFGEFHVLRGHNHVRTPR